MAKSLLMRPFMSSAFRAPLLCRFSIPYYFQTRTLVSLTTSGKVPASSGNGIKLHLHDVSYSSGSKFEGLITFTGRRSFCVRAADVNNSGSIDPPLIQSMEQKIKEQLNADVVIVKDAYGDGRHVSIDVISSAFEGQSAVNRQRMVYKAIWEELQSTVHAVDQMTTKTPTEAAKNR
ncbi:BolA protein [Macleaya cordata]|uniref:BolA protein n=1 Tax=Macleaya cordata TaxID=56857 RepID=A0A200R6M1_MACCD|nr:BolA protein [Macleaya cordata]